LKRKCTFMNEEDYKKRRQKYTPKKIKDIKVIFVLESPPQDNTYFYDPEHGETKNLYKAMMKLIKYVPKNKHDGLKRFVDLGFLIVDVCYTPVNGLNNRLRNEMLMSCESSLKKDLRSLIKDNSTPLILVKAPVCRFFEPCLSKCGFNVINDGLIIPFPSTGHQIEFYNLASELLKRHKLLPE